MRKWPPEDWHLAFQGNLHLLSKSDFFLLETEMLKLRDGREQALLQIEAELAQEEGRSTTQRERRRRGPGRGQGRPAAAGSGEKPREQPESAENDPKAQETKESQQASGDQSRGGGRQRRGSRQRSRNRQAPAGRSPEYDNG